MQHIQTTIYCVELKSYSNTKTAASRLPLKKKMWIELRFIPGKFVLVISRAKSAFERTAKPKKNDPLVHS